MHVTIYVYVHFLRYAMSNRLLSPMAVSCLSVYLEIYGCQMNVNDADIAWTFLSEAGYGRTEDVEEVGIWGLL